MADELDEFRAVFKKHDLGFSDALAMLRSHFFRAMSSNDNVVRYSHRRGRPERRTAPPH